MERTTDDGRRAAGEDTLHAVFPGESEMSRRCRAHDWAATPLGPVEGWPRSLRTVAGLVLAAPVGMIVLWGPELVQLYNDAYSTVMGAKHPGGLGQRNRECWPEVSDFTAPVCGAVLERGEAFTFVDQPLVLERNGAPEEAFFSLSYSAVPDADGTAGGVLVTVFETTAQVRGRLAEAEHARLVEAGDAERTALLADAFRRAPSFLAVYRGPDHVYALANDAYYQLVGHGRAILGKPLLEALPEVRGQGFDLLLDRVLETGEPFVAREIPVRLARTPGAPPEDRVVALTYLPLGGPDGAADGVIAHGADVTEYVLARRELEQLLAANDAARREELEDANQQLQEQAVELELQAEELHATAAELEERTEAAEASLAALAESEARFRAVEDASPDAVLLLEPVVAGDEIVDFEFVYANAAAGRMLGGGAVDALVGQRMLTVFPSSAAEGYFPAYVRVFGTGAPFTREDRYARDGLDIGVRVTAVRAGALVHLRHEDIAQRLRAEAERADLLAELRAERERLRALVLQMPAPVALHVGPELRFEVINPAFRQISGGGRDDTGLAVRDAFPELPGQGIIEALERVYATGEPWAAAEVPIRYDRRGRGLEDTWFDIRYEAVRGPAGEVIGVLNFAVDVTDQVRARREAERLLAEAEAARREAAAANQAKSGFLATMSHELRTPINAVIGYAQLLDMRLAGPLTEQQRAYLDRLTGSSRHLLGLVADVLDLSKIEAGETRVAHEDATTGPAVRDGLDVVAPAAVARGVRLVDARSDEAGVPFVGDEDRVRQVVLNLLSNAVKFTAPGGTITVTSDTVAATPPTAAHLRGAGPWALVRVEDTGVGIAPEEQGRIFEPFHQVQDGKNFYTRTAGGTGLGLAISRRLARLMGGDLSVESAPGAGSAFTLWLPAARHDAGRPDETAGDRSARAERDFRRLETPGLGEVGGLLHAAVTEVIAAYTDRLRADPGVPRGATMTRIQLEDHAISFLADLAQSLVIVGDAGPEAVELLKDGSAIQRTIAEAHGARRHAQGWDEAALRRDQQVFREEVERAVRERLKRGSDDVNEAVRVLLGLIDRGQGIAQSAWRRAAADATP